MSDQPIDPGQCWLTSSHSLLTTTQPLPVALPHRTRVRVLAGRAARARADDVCFREILSARDLLRIASVLQIASILTEVAWPCGDAIVCAA
jgi:hypothetical protein